MAVFASKSLRRRTGSVHESRPAARSWLGDFAQKLHCVLRYVCGYEYLGSSALSHAHRSRSEEVVGTMPRTFLHRAKRRRRAVIAVNLFWSGVVVLLATPCRSESAEDPAPQVPQTQLPAPEPSATQVATPQTGSSRWFNPATAPFLPILPFIWCWTTTPLTRPRKFRHGSCGILATTYTSLPRTVRG